MGIITNQRPRLVRKNPDRSISTMRLVLLLLLGLFFMTRASAQFIVDGNPIDWNATPAGAHVQDPFGNGVLDNQFTQGSKDFHLAANLRWAIGQTKAKNDIANAAAFLDGAILRFAGDRTSNNGDAQIGFWFYLNGTGPVTQGDGTQNFAPEHYYDPVTGIGDLLIIANFTNGGTSAAVIIYKWVGTGGNVANTNGALNTTNLVGTAAQNNASAFPVPTGWNFINPTYDLNEFYEGQVDLTTYIAGNPVCISTFLLEARSSQEVTASLDDFVGGPFAGKPGPPTVTPGSRCGAGTVLLSASCAGGANIETRWFADATGGPVLNTGPTYSPNVTQTTTFYVSCYNTVLQCESDRTPVTATVNENPTANAGPDQAKCQTPPSGPTAFTMAGTAANGTTLWSQIGSTGTASASIVTPGSLTTTVNVSGTGTVTLRLTTTSNTTPSCGTATDDVVLTVNANPTAAAGPDQTKCQTAPSGPTAFTMAGTAANGTTAWTQIGSTGTASASIVTPGSLSTTVNVSGIGTVTLRLTTTSNTTPACGTATDDVVLTVNSNPTANAGPDQTLCQTPPSGPTAFVMAGTAANGTTAWTQIGSTGTASASIVTPGSLTTTVNVSGIGTVTLRLTTTSNTTPSCGTATDDVVLAVNTIPTANAGPDQAKCQVFPAGPTPFTLAGTATNGTTLWSQIGSTGTASASITTPGALNSAVSVSGAGTVTLRLTTTSNATPSCGTATDDVVLTVNALPLIRTLVATNFCPSDPFTGGSLTLQNAQVGVSYQLQLDNVNVQAPKTAVNPGDNLTWTGLVAGNYTVEGTFIATNCNTESGPATINENNSPLAAAGPDQAKCQTPPSGPTAFTLAGSGSGGTFAWTQVGSTGTASASIVSPTALNSAVNVSGIGTVTLRLTTTSTATPPCGNTTDDVILTVNANPTANAGPDQAKCQTPPSGPTAFTMAGTAANGTTAWTQIGSTGTASASIVTPGSLVTTVNVSGVGTVTLRLTTTSNATPSCGTATDDVVLTVVANPTANAGPDQAKCQTPPSGPTAFTLAGTAANGTTAWSQIGSTGTASASIVTPGALNSAVNVSGIGTVTLRLTTTSNTTPACGTATDDIVLTVNPNPTAVAGPDQAKCQTPPSGPTAFTMAGTATNGTTAWSQIGSTGTASASIVTPGSLNTTVNVSGTGTVTLRLTTTSTNCGTATDDVVLTVNANPVVTADNKTVCAGECVVLTGNPAGGVFSGAGVSFDAQAQVYQYCAGATPGTFVVTYTFVNQSGCTGTATAEVTVEQCVFDFHCSYTQGFFGNTGGNGTDWCDGITTYASRIDMFNNLIGAGITVGRPGRSVIIPTGSAATLVTVMPGGGPAKVLAAGDCNIGVSTACLPLKNGKIGNVLLSQTIALSMNIRLNGGSLTNFPLEGGKYLVTQDRNGCGEDAETVSCSDDPNAIQSFFINEAVVNYLNLPGGYDATVGGLLELANDVLGGVLTPGSGGVPSFGDVTSVVDAINRGFDECRAYVGYFYCPATCSNLGPDNPPATVDAGPNQNINSGSTVNLAGVVGGGASTGTWTTSGDGTFAPDNTTLNAVYTPGAADLLAGSVTLTLTADPLGPCPAVSDNMVVTINVLARAVDAGIRSAASQPESSVTIPTELSVSTFPNPFKDKVSFVIASPVSGQATLEVFNQMGQKVQVVYKGYLFAGRNQVVEYNVPGTVSSNLFYRLRVGDKFISGKLLSLK